MAYIVFAARTRRQLVSVLLYSYSAVTTIRSVCVVPAGHRLISISVFLLSQFALFHSTTATSCIYVFFLFLLSSFLSPFFSLYLFSFQCYGSSGCSRLHVCIAPMAGCIYSWTNID